ncbi:MAG: branched-chain amino acid ABC transporter permease, partial [Candidatus Binatia bacterium]
FLLTLGWSLYGEEARATVRQMPAGTQQGIRWGGLLLGALFLLFLPQIFGLFPTEVVDNVALLGILMGLGLNIVVGFAGLLDLGYVGFFAIGAYTMALLTSSEIGLAQLTFWQALPFSILTSVLAGVILGIPVLNMRGDYLAIVTLGFGEIIRILFLSDALAPYFNGARGIVAIPSPSVMGNALNTPQELYYVILVGVIVAWFISLRLRDSRLGRAWMAVREDEDVAEAMGIHLVTTKLLAFGMGAALAGLGGAIFASKLQSIVPQTFNLLISINALSIIIIGGLASVPGVLIGALLLIGLPELLREFNEYRLWLYGALLVVMMLFKPEGFWPDRLIKRELHDVGHPEMPEQATVPVPEGEDDTISDSLPGPEPRTLRT